MITLSYPIPVTEGSVQANGLNMWYVEAGQGNPLILLHAGTVSNGPIWADHKWGWGAHLGAFAKYFRVIAPDSRGHGRTVNPTGELSYPLLADDLQAFIQAIGVERPLVCGFSDGGVTAALLEIRHPGTARAVVNFGGFEPVTPDLERGLPPSRTTEPDINYFVPMFTQWGGPDWFRLFQEDYDDAQGPGYWRTYLTQAPRMWNMYCGYTNEDFQKIDVPTLILSGDRDHFGSVEEAVAAYRYLPQGELGIVPNTGHDLTPLVCAVALDFLLRRGSDQG